MNIIDLKSLMDSNINDLVKIAKKFYLSNPKGIAFIAKIAVEIKKSMKKREEMSKQGIDAPPFLIASITSSCNLACKGCYSRATGDCSDNNTADLTCGEWQKIFEQSAQCGVNFILLAGGEPLIRKDVIKTAALFKNIVFPIFTNGTLIDESYIRLFEKHRNLIPVFSIEGDKDHTNKRRGENAYEIVQNATAHFAKKKMLYGASVTVSKENISNVVTQDFVLTLKQQGCGVVFFVEYVPIEAGTEHLMLDTSDIKYLQKEVESLRSGFDDIIVIAFPGDEDMLGGCLASGRGFFHINAKGGAEPCPFSPYSVLNLKNNTLLEVLSSDFFKEMQQIAASEAHLGGCTLFNSNEKVQELLKKYNC